MVEQIVVVPKTKLLEVVMSSVGIQCDRGRFVNLGDYSALDACLATMPRTPELEKDLNWVQLVNYTVLKDNEEKFFVYQRSKGAGEERLLGKLSLGLGGHLNIGDLFNTDQGVHSITLNDLFGTYFKALYRELKEELGLQSGLTVGRMIYKAYLDDDQPALLYMDHDDVSRVHAGLVEVLEVPYTSTELGLYLKEPGMIDKGWYTLQELQANVNQFEDWSQEVIKWLS